MNEQLISKIKIPSSGRHLEDVRNFIEKSSRECGLDESQIYDLKVAAGEACANAIEHGSPDDEKNFVEVEFFCGDNGVYVTVKDEGKFKRQAMEYDADGLHHRGRGMAFMLALMDEVSVQGTDNGTVVKLHKKL